MDTPYLGPDAQRASSPHRVPAAPIGAGLRSSPILNCSNLRSDAIGIGWIAAATDAPRSRTVNFSSSCVLVLLTGDSKIDWTVVIATGLSSARPATSVNKDGASSRLVRDTRHRTTVQLVAAAAAGRTGSCAIKDAQPRGYAASKATHHINLKGGLRRRAA
eukprot:scaffold86073_cov64-Phaeocystis_antarctica.AAC.1